MVALISMAALLVLIEVGGASNVLVYQRERGPWLTIYLPIQTSIQDGLNALVRAGLILHSSSASCFQAVTSEPIPQADQAKARSVTLLWKSM
jgi:hypothetical protein